MKNRKAYVTVAWGLDDIREHRPDWTEERCRAFLGEHGQSIVDAMALTGWEIIEDLLLMAEQEEMPSWQVVPAQEVEA